jgi:hypothetical protein
MIYWPKSLLTFDCIKEQWTFYQKFIGDNENYVFYTYSSLCYVPGEA